MVEVFLLHDDDIRSDAIRQAIGLNGDLSLVNEAKKGRDSLLALSSIPPGRPRILIVRLLLQDMTGLDVISQVKQRHNDVYIVPVLEGDEGGQIWQRLVQFGLNDFINGPISPEEMVTVLSIAAKKAQQQYESARAQKTGQVTESFLMTVASARSGVGKTVFSTNLAAALAKFSKSVALLDCSLNPGDFPVMLDDVPRNTIMEAVNAGGGIDVELLLNLLSTHKLGFRYLACPNEDFDPKGFDYNITTSILQAMRSVASHVVIDTGLCYAEPTIAAADVSDLIFVITSRDVTRLLSAQRFLKLLKEREISPSKIKVIVNQAEIGVEISENEIESTLEHPVSAYIPSNPGPVTYSINRGEPLVISEPNEPISQIITRLAQLCYNRWQMDKVANPQGSKTKGLFKKTSFGFGG
ncbi:MAG: P-loop NTPase [Verrucomicrobiota bacterium]